MAIHEVKSCAACGREIAWRTKWARSWPEVKYCSDACRRRAKSSAGRGTDAALERAMLDLLRRRDPSAAGDSSMCPS